MTGSKFGPGHGMDQWSHNIGDILDEMRHRSFFDFRDSGVWQPATNVYEAAEHYHICVELAGVSAEAIKVEFVGSKRVVLTGHRPQPRPADVADPLSVHIMEIDEGAFAREIDLPEPVNCDDRSVFHREGYLWIILPKTANK